MKRSKFLLAAMVVAAMLACATTYAQEQVGSIVGMVNDKDGAPLPGVMVEVSGDVAKQTKVTDAKGEYYFPGLFPGTYTLTAKLEGFSTSELTSVRLDLGKTLRINFTLQPAKFQEAITVTADIVNIDVGKSSTSTAITKQDMDQLPHGTDFTSVVGLAPGARQEAFSAGIQIDGASGSENRFIIDGVDTTSALDGLSGQNMITSFLEEVQVKSTGYNAEYGGALGGVINAVTRSGANDFHGVVEVMYTDTEIGGGAARQTPYASSPTLYETFPKDKQTQLQPGFGLGGPIFRDKAWFFVGYEPTLIDQTRYPVGDPNSYSQSQTSTYAVANIKGNIGSSFLYKLSYNYSPYTVKGTLPNVDGSTPAGTNFGVNNDYPSQSYSAYLDWVASTVFLASARFGHFTQDQNTSGVKDPFRIWFRSGSNASGPMPVPTTDPRYRPIGFATVPNPSFQATIYDKWDRDYAAIDGTLFFDLAGGHAVKLGYQYEKVKNSVLSGEYGNLFEIRWGFPDRFGTGVIGQYGSLHVRSFKTDGGAEDQNNSIFIQDTWAIGKNFTLNIGVRTEMERVPNYGFKTDPTLPEWAIEFDYGDKLAPRLGFAWDVKGDQKWKVWGSWGRYYDITKLSMPRGSFGADKWIAYLYPLNTLDWNTLPNGCTTSVNNAAVNPCPALGTPVTRDLRKPTNPYDSIDPNLKPMGSDEWQLGTEYALSSYSKVGARYVNKQLLQTIEDIGYLVCDSPGNCSEEYVTGNPGMGLVVDPTWLANTSDQGARRQPKAIRDYQALELTYNKMFQNNWMLYVSYTYSQLKGNYSGLASSDEIINVSGNFGGTFSSLGITGLTGRTDPNVARYFDGLVYGYGQDGKLVDGALGTDRTHDLLISGNYRTPWNMSIGLNQVFRSGVPTTTQGQYNGVYFYPAGRNDLGRTPNVTQTDLYLAQPFKLGGLQLEVNLTVLNLFDQKTTILRYANISQSDICDLVEGCDFSNDWYFNELVPYNIHDIVPSSDLDPYYDKDYYYQSPRTLRFGVKLTF